MTSDQVRNAPDKLDECGRTVAVFRELPACEVEQAVLENGGRHLVPVLLPAYPRLFEGGADESAELVEPAIVLGPHVHEGTVPAGCGAWRHHPGWPATTILMYTLWPRGRRRRCGADDGRSSPMAGQAASEARPYCGPGQPQLIEGPFRLPSAERSFQG